ncbi:M23 family metallopeptidase [Hymenobacter elongatus]|uniref:M23 family metallopeptidase n=1 Tax=Hymenobacter elongatus TaxID=877208 RepID=A0A4Z0PRE5_9BACT|nr:M23 family metallopeptidase [Hymenobacter elongatus]TGE18032.1 M23 family metallopeptidase [Hymenobacter elongatus]
MVVDRVSYRDGRVASTAHNTGFVPATAFLNATLVKMVSDVSLPAKIVVFPTKKPRVLAHLTPTGPGFSFQYTFDDQMGICNGRLPDTTFVYRLPFAPSQPSTILYPATHKRPKSGQMPIRFALPGSPPARAARAGMVANIKQDSNKGSRRVNYKDSNWIVIFHEDGTYAWYNHLRQNGAAVQIGQYVGAGQRLGYSGRTSKSWEPLRGFCVAYPSEPKALEHSVLSQTDSLQTGYLTTGQILPAK